MARKIKNHRLHWTEEEKQLLNEMMYVYPIGEIADLLGRTELACKNMFYYGPEHRQQSEAERKRWEDRDPTKAKQ